jgi:hypothetical protein
MAECGGLLFFAVNFALRRRETRTAQEVLRVFAADFLQKQQIAAGTGKRRAVSARISRRCSVVWRTALPQHA